MNVNKLYDLWHKNIKNEKNLKQELESIAGNEEEIKERFGKTVNFGTAGLRGIMGVGPNRLNVYTIRWVTQGLADYLIENFAEPIVAIAFDSRHNSEIFAYETAKVLFANGIKVFIANELQPTPVLSFCVRRLKCHAGVMITASHNTFEYNGYKCYGMNGSQMVQKVTKTIYENMLKIDIFNDVKIKDFDAGVKSNLINFIKPEIYDEYLNCVLSRRIDVNSDKELDVKIIYTPLNGTGNKLVHKVFKKIKVKQVIMVPEQEYPDGNFSTCPYPNPEVAEAFNLALNLAKKELPDIIIATDPDSDRAGIIVYHENDFKILNGNEIGVLLFNYIITRRIENSTCPKDPILVKTIVSSKMIDKIAEKYHCKLIITPIGFKYVGAEMFRLEQNNELDKYVFGFEESHGYLTGTHERDKDAVEASMLLAEMTAYYKKQNKTLIDVLSSLNQEYGFHGEMTLNFKFGQNRAEKIENIMDLLRKNPPKNFGGINIIKVEDYLKIEKFSVKLNMILYILEGRHNVIFRPSGTEPKMKIYIMTENFDQKLMIQQKNAIIEHVETMMHEFGAL